MARLYHRDQSGAPTLTYSTTSNAVAHFTAFKTVLKACLVTGYGEYPAAGWELINEGTNFLVLRNGSESGYVCFTWASGIITIWLAATYESVTSDVIVGTGKKTGIAANNTTPQKFNCCMRAYSASVFAWSMVADEKTFVLTWANYANVDYAMDSATDTYALSTLYVGEDSSGNFISCGGLNTTTTSSSYGTPTSRFGPEGFTSLYNPSTGLLVDTGALTVNVPGLELVTAASSTSLSPPALASVSIAPAFWYGGSGLGGQLRGVCLVPQLANTYGRSNGAIALGISAGLTFRVSNTLVDLGDGNGYLVGMAGSAVPFFLLTDNPDFWP